MKVSSSLAELISPMRLLAMAAKYTSGASISSHRNRRVDDTQTTSLDPRDQYSGGGTLSVPFAGPKISVLHRERGFMTSFLKTRVTLKAIEEGLKTIKRSGQYPISGQSVRWELVLKVIPVVRQGCRLSKVATRSNRTMKKHKSQLLIMG